jgi:hypothetical protein
VAVDFAFNPAGGTVPLPAIGGFTTTLNYPSNTTTNGPVTACVIETFSAAQNSQGVSVPALGIAFTMSGGTANPGTITFALGGGNANGTITPGAITSTVTNASFAPGDNIIQEWSTNNYVFNGTVNSSHSAEFISPFDNATQAVPSGSQGPTSVPLTINYYDNGTTVLTGGA